MAKRAAHIISSRNLHIRERTAVLKRMGDNWPYRAAALEEIALCKREIAKAKATA